MQAFRLHKLDFIYMIFIQHKLIFYLGSLNIHY